MQTHHLKWYDLLAINAYWIGINVSSSVTPILLPYLILLFINDQGLKNTYWANIRVVALAVAMLVQPLAGLLSDRSMSPMGKRRPFIIISACFNIIFFAIVGASTFFNSPDVKGGSFDSFSLATFGVTAAFLVLFIGFILKEISSNTGHGPLQGLIPDMVPENQRGLASGIKSTFEVLPILLLIFIGPLVNSGQIWLVIGILSVGFLITMALTVLFVKETPNTEKPTTSIWPSVLRLVALTAVFVGITQGGVWLVNYCATQLTQMGASQVIQVILVGLVGLLAMAGSIFVGVYAGAWVGIGKDAPKQRAFIWWVVNRLLFLAAVTGIRDFAQYYLRDVLKIENAASASSMLLAVIGIFLVISSLVGGYLSDRIGRRKLIAIAGIIGAVGAFLTLPARSLGMVYVAGGIVGLGAGLFMASNWALGTELVPKEQAGKYLGISNLAGAGAGIVGTGIGGPMADFFNRLTPGMGYWVIFSIYGVLFLLSIAVLSRVRKEA